VIRLNRTAFLIAALMCVTSMGAVVARPDAKVARTDPPFSLEAMIPTQFGEWREEPRRIVQVINPQARELLDTLYSQILERIYVNAEGYLIILSVAYGADQRGSLRAHEPEGCYSGAGFMVTRRESTQIATPYGEIPVLRFFMIRGPRKEPVTYWLKVGDKVVRTWQSKLMELGYTLTGRRPDGFLFRVSSLDPDQAQANRVQDQFINQLLQSVSPEHRKRLSGLGDS
jgi:EpsI family protein